jgi:uncharacterized protein (TIGR03083 family)
VSSLRGDLHIAALRSSVHRLHELTASLPEVQLTQRAYPSKWTIADVLSHLGSGAVITQRRLEDSFAGQQMPDDFAPRAWDEWNAKGPVAKRDDALAADAALLAAIDAVAADQRNSFASPLGPMIIDFEKFVGLRLNEHALHTWDIEVVGDQAATLESQSSSLIVDNLELVAGYTAKATGTTGGITVATTEPERRFRIELTKDAVAFSRETSTAHTVDVRLPAEAFCRLVYGRLDAAHAPPGSESEILNSLRAVFPGP